MIHARLRRERKQRLACERYARDRRVEATLADIKRSGGYAISMCQQLTGVHYSNYFNTLEAIKGEPVWCHNCGSKGINIVAKLQDDMKNRVLFHGTGSRDSQP